MPLYEFECKNCHHRFEKILKFSDPHPTTCPNCGKEGVEQVLSAPAVQFKGSGWYVTDYARKSGTAASSATKAGESKSESKPDAKPDTSSSSSADKK